MRKGRISVISVYATCPARKRSVLALVLWTRIVRWIIAARNVLKRRRKCERCPILKIKYRSEYPVLAKRPNVIRNTALVSQRV